MEYLSALLQESSSPEMAKEALLIAICIGSRPLVEMILTLFQDFPHEERSGCSNSALFLPHITPLMLACILNNFAIVQCLLLRGHTIDLPHHSTCKCDLCLRMSNSNMDGLRRVDAMRAISSEAFLWLATDDPFAAACSLAQDIEICMDNDNFEFMKCYCPLATCANPYPRIQLALEAKMRQFVGTPNVQRAMSCIWWRGWGNFGTNLLRDSYRVLRHVFFYPVLAVLFIVTNGKLASSFEVPLASYATFVACLIAIRYVKIGEQAKFVHTPSGYPKYKRRGNNGKYAGGIAIETYCYLYVTGMLTERYIQFTRYGFRNYFNFWWRWFDVLLIGVFYLALHLWLTGILMPMEPDLVMLSRTHWPAWDYFLIYDIYVCTGCTLGLWKTFYFFQLIKGIGGSVISVGRCVSTIYNYLLVMAVIMFSFAVGVNLLVQPYLNSIMVTEDGSTEKMSLRFSSIHKTLRSMYWAVYGYLDPSTYPVVAGNSGPEQAPVDHSVTSFAIEAILTFYHCIIVIALLNLMVSLLVKKADEVLENEESEFKYTRVVIYSEFIDWSSSVPPPFNLLYIIIQIAIKLLRDKNVVVAWPEIWTDKKLAYPDPDATTKDCNAYNNIMMTLFSRFRATKECHYRSVFRTEFDKDRAAAESPAKVAFMNTYNDRFDAFQQDAPRGLHNVGEVNCH
ncbi:transporter, cation channel family protein [Dictyocaulus viviparus]|uniref:Transporter, cation channel family protein n=1 Tax=Dictyocaulus viviparus TaxID=29172 RepID=A0A0D8XA65_DICVI|nr:transporter, cation channel family protein [Dictyocaulus viviparus]